MNTNKNRCPITSAIIVDFVDGLDSAADISDCFKILTTAVEQLGFAGIAYTSIPIGLKPIDNQNPIFLSSSGFNRKFLSHYEEANFAQDDFTIKRILDGDIRPINWWQEENQGILQKAEKQVIQVAKEDYGIVNGLSIPTLSSLTHIAGASVISEEQTPLFNQLLSERVETLKKLIRLFHNHIYANVQFEKIFYLPLLDSLTQQEKQVLQHIASGDSLKLIADYYKISSSRAGNIRSDLFKKLGVKNSCHLAFLVGMHRILEMT